MLATVKETVKSLQDTKYGGEIIKKSVGQVLWYWTKYLLVVLILVAGSGVAALTYFTPQLAGILTKNLPDLSLSVKNGEVITNVPQPFVQSDGNFAFIVDTKGSLSELDNYKSGALVLKDKLVVKSETETKIVDLKEFEGANVSRKILVDWVSTNRPTILAAGLAFILVLTLVLGGFYWISRLLSFFVGALVIWLSGKIFKKNLSYQGAFKITVYASVLPFIISAISVFSASGSLSILTMAAFLFYALAWVYNLPTSTKTK